METSSNSKVESTSNVKDLRDRDPTYHTTNAEYTLPNDAVEYARLRDQAIGLDEMMHNKSVHAPLANPQQIVDVGCGTGIITRQLGEKYTNARVYGIDLSPVPAGQTTPNVEFILGDVRKLIGSHPRLAVESTDFVFSRLLVLGMTDWQGYVKDMMSIVRPGGWVEMQDLVIELYLHGSHCSGDWEWMKAIYTSADKKGLDLQCGKNIKRYMEEAGLEDIVVKEYRMPFGTWLAGERPETRTIGEHTAREYGMLYYHAIPKMLQGTGYTEERLEEFQTSCLKDLTGRDGLEGIFYVTIGRKPDQK
ncbi:MAG: hypothetical protein Q9204_008486 [Flavoplaca sp. TL-2023a]